MSRRLVSIMTVATIALAGCGGGDEDEEGLSEDGVRECLAGSGLGTEKPTGPDYAPVTAAVPDFSIYADTSINVAVYGTQVKAERAAADVSAAIRSLGSPAEVVSKENVVVIFGKAPSEETRAAVDDCLA